jgi:hypothetical protein
MAKRFNQCLKFGLGDLLGTCQTRDNPADIGYLLFVPLGLRFNAY